MIEDDEHHWKASIETRENNERGRALRRHAGTVLLAIFITPAVLEATLFLAILLESWLTRPQTNIDLGGVFFLYFAMLIFGFPVVLPIAISHVVCTGLLQRHLRLTWLTAAASGAVHGLAAVVLFAAIYSSGPAGNWMDREALVAFGTAGLFVGLALHAAAPRKTASATAP